MRLTIETNWWARFKGFMGRRTRREACILSAELILVLLFIGGAYLFWIFKPLLRDFYVANVAHVRAGPIIPFEEGEAGYTRGYRVEKDIIYSFGMDTNLKWAAEYTRRIVPFMWYEGVAANSIMPKTVGAVPFLEKDSFHVGGRMIPTKAWAVLLNERYVVGDTKWNDKRRALATLVHEIVHAQGGAYLRGKPEEFEPATVSATTEVLAAMCLNQDELACKAFWYEIEDLARASLTVQSDYYGIRWLNEWWSDTFWRNDLEVHSYRKSMRFWKEYSPGELMSIFTKYYVVPWKKIRWGIAHGIPLNTGTIKCEERQLSCGAKVPGTPGIQDCKILGMRFNDTWYLMRGLLWSLK